MPKFELCQKVDKTSSFTTCTISNFGGTILNYCNLLKQW